MQNVEAKDQELGLSFPGSLYNYVGKMAEGVKHREQTRRVFEKEAMSRAIRGQYRLLHTQVHPVRLHFASTFKAELG